MKMLNNIKAFNKSIIVLSLGLALTACGSDLNEVVPTPESTPVVNNVPSITSTSVDAATAGTDYSYTLAATDADGDTLIMSATTLPDWLMFDAASGVLSGMPADTDGGDSAIVLVVSDGTDEVTQSFTITVTVPEPVNTAAVITSTAVTSATVGQAYSYTLTATDVDEDMLTMSATVPGGLSWLSFDAETGVLSGTPASGDVMATSISLTVNDGTDDTTQTFTITVVASGVTGGINVLANLYDDAVTGDIIFDSYNPEGAIAATEMAEGDRGNVIEVVKTGAVGNWYLNSSTTPFDISGYDADSELVFDMYVVSADAGVELYIKLDSGWPNVSDVVVDTSLMGEWQEVRINLQTLLADGNAFSAGAFADATNIVNPFVMEPTGVMTVKFDNIRYESTGGDTGGDTGGSDPVATGDVNLYDDAVTGDIVFDSYNPEGAIAATEMAEGDRGNVIEVVKTGAVGNWYLNSSTTPFDISGYDADSELVFDMYVVSADAGVELYIKLDSGWPNVSDVVVDTSLMGEWQEVRINLQTLLADGNAFSAGAFADATNIVNPFVMEPTGVMTVKFDNIRYESTGGDTGGDPEPGTIGGITDIGDTGYVTNGGFESGDLTGWATDGAGTLSAMQDDLSTWLVKIVAGEAQNPSIVQAKIGEGVITAGQALTVSFDMKGSAGPGGVINAILYSEDPSGVSKTDLLLGGAVPNADWTAYSFDVTAGDLVGFGVSLRLEPVCGAVAGCTATAYFDNVSITAQ